jgi:hypothetical protein
LAELGEQHADIRALGVEIAAVSVDRPPDAEAMRRRYELPFPLLCDPDARFVHRCGLFDPAEKGGIARPATFVLDRQLGVRFRALDGVVTRVRAADLRAYLAGTAGPDTPPAPRPRVLLPTPGEMLRTALPALRLALAPPRRRARPPDQGGA